MLPTQKLNVEELRIDLQGKMRVTQARMGERFTDNQILGRLSTIGCVAVEITQKCNLDCIGSCSWISDSARN